MSDHIMSQYNHNEIIHAHGAYPHVHSEEVQKAILNRLSKAIGHLKSVKRMVERGENCSDVLIQLAAVHSALPNTGKIILQNHISQCIVEAINHDDYEAVEHMNHAIDQFIRY